MTTASIEEIYARLKDLAPDPDPEAPDVADQLARFLIIQAQRRFVLLLDPRVPAGSAQLAALCGEFAAAHVLSRLIRETVDPAAVQRLAAEIAAAWDDGGGVGELLREHARALNVDTGEVSRLADAEAALRCEEDKAAPRAAGGSGPAGARPLRVCLCGSTRYRSEFAEANRAETLAGNIVLAPGVFGGSGDALPPGGTKTLLDELHRRKIDLCHEVLVVSDRSGYFGDSTMSEITYAASHGKKIRFAEPAAMQRAADLNLIPAADLPAGWHPRREKEITAVHGQVGFRERDCWRPRRIEGSRPPEATRGREPPAGPAEENRCRSPPDGEDPLLCPLHLTYLEVCLTTL